MVPIAVSGGYPLTHQRSLLLFAPPSNGRGGAPLLTARNLQGGRAV